MLQNMFCYRACTIIEWALESMIARCQGTQISRQYLESQDCIIRSCVHITLSQAVSSLARFRVKIDIAVPLVHHALVSCFASDMLNRTDLVHCL